MEVESHRKRQLNYTVKEENALISLVVDRKDIIESTRNDAVAWKQKDAAWQDIAGLFSKITGVHHRSAKMLRNKYDNIKKKVKRGSYENEHISKIVLTTKIKQLMAEDDTSAGIKPESEEPLNNIMEFNEESFNDDAFTQNKKSSRKRTNKIDVGSLLRQEKLQLIKAQRNFYEQENLRAQEKHMEEMETLSAKRELLYLEIAEKKRKLNDSSKEL